MGAHGGGRTGPCDHARNDALNHEWLHWRGRCRHWGAGPGAEAKSFSPEAMAVDRMHGMRNLFLRIHPLHEHRHRRSLSKNCGGGCTAHLLRLPNDAWLLALHLRASADLRCSLLGAHVRGGRIACVRHALSWQRLLAHEGWCDQPLVPERRHRVRPRRLDLYDFRLRPGGPRSHVPELLSQLLSAQLELAPPAQLVDAHRGHVFLSQRVEDRPVDGVVPQHRGHLKRQRGQRRPTCDLIHRPLGEAR
mmetsp:Transcript_109242/g.308144  ORF Transcript_109242/g.308144 Transcript_109242/m.308144 type:complete len:248 (-) Transcript_109242:210-953(-)